MPESNHFPDDHMPVTFVRLLLEKPRSGLARNQYLGPLCRVMTPIHCHCGKGLPATSFRKKLKSGLKSNLHRDLGKKLYGISRKCVLRHFHIIATPVSLTAVGARRRDRKVQISNIHSKLELDPECRRSMMAWVAFMLHQKGKVSYLLFATSDEAGMLGISQRLGFSRRRL